MNITDDPHWEKVFKIYASFIARILPYITELDNYNFTEKFKNNLSLLSLTQNAIYLLNYMRKNESATNKDNFLESFFIFICDKTEVEFSLFISANEDDEIFNIMKLNSIDACVQGCYDNEMFQGFCKYEPQKLEKILEEDKTEEFYKLYVPKALREDDEIIEDNQQHEAHFELHEDNQKNHKFFYIFKMFSIFASVSLIIYILQSLSIHTLKELLFILSFGVLFLSYIGSFFLKVLNKRLYNFALITEKISGFSFLIMYALIIFKYDFSLTWSKEHLFILPIIIFGALLPLLWNSKE